MADVQSTSKNTVNRVWQINDINPHLQKHFKRSRDPKFVEKLTDVVGLYLNPQDKAIVLWVVEKSQVQDYKRNGTTTLFAALNYLEGK